MAKKQASTRRAPTASILRAASFARGVEDRRAGHPPRFDDGDLERRDDIDQYDGIVVEAHKIQDAVSAYIDRGWSPVPIMLKTAKGKGGGFAEWQRIVVTHDNLKEYFPNAQPRNIGIKLGKPSAGLTDVDLDCPEAIPLAAHFLPDTKAIFGRTGKQYSHYLYRTDLWESATQVAVVFKEIHKADPKLTRTLVELRTGRQNEDGTSAGSQTVVPPSWHKDDERVRWHVEGEPAAVDGSDLKHSSLKLAVATLLVRNYPGETQRHNGALVIGGLLARAGWSAEDIEQTLLAAAEAANDEEATARVKDAASATTLENRGKRPPGINKVREGWGDVVADSLADWLKLKLTKADDAVAQAATQTAKLVQHARDNTELFHSPDGTAYADIVVNGHRETWPVQSETFKGMLLFAYYKGTGCTPNPESIKSAISTLVVAARYDCIEQRVALRYANVGDTLYVDLCDKEWRAVEITAEGWKVVPQPLVRFIREAVSLPLPVPQHGGSLDLLRRHLNLNRAVDDDDDNAAHDDNFVLTVGFVLKAMMRDFGPYPILALVGEFGAAKTSFLKALIRIIDPNEATLRGPPRNERDMHIAGRGRHLLAYDNLSDIPQWLSDAMCRVSTGGAFGTRALYANASEQVFKTLLPQMVSSTKPVVLSHDLADRSVSISPGTLTAKTRRTDNDFDAGLERDAPLILGVLYDMLAHGLRELPRIKELVATKQLDLPRMADFAQWMNACETLYWPAGTFNAAYARNRRKVGRGVLGADNVAVAMCEYLEETPTWTGSATELLEILSARVGPTQRAEKEWPKSPRAMSNRLSNVRQWLEREGIAIVFGKRNGRVRPITISRVGRSSDGPVTVENASSPNNSLKTKENDDVTIKPLMSYGRSKPLRNGGKYEYKPRSYAQMKAFLDRAGWKK